MSEAIIKHAGKNIEVTASLPHEMQQCQTALMKWCQQKIASIRDEINTANSEMEIAIKHKWRASGWKKQIALAEKRIVFFGKIMAALKAGYSIIPNFPITIFAIRTKAKEAKGFYEWATWNNSFEQKAQTLPEGEGEFKNPFPVVLLDTSEEVKDGKTIEKKHYYPEGWKDIEFPVSMAKPHIMESTAEAMKAGFFDQLGICPPERKRDPMIIAQIIDPTPVGYGERKVISFLVAWHFNSNIFG